MALSLIGILLIKFTDLENSEIDVIRFSLGNFIHNFGRFYGIMNSCNTLGPLAAISGLIAIIKMKTNFKDIRKVATYAVIITMNTYLLIGSKSITAIIGFFAAIIMLFLLSLKKRRKTILVALILIAILGVAVFIINIDYFSELTNKNLRTISDRTILWNNAGKIIKQNPIIGTGSQASYIEIAEENDLMMNKNGTHNIILETAILYGIPAAILFAISLVSTVLQILIRYLKGYEIDDNLLIFAILLLVLNIINGIMETATLYAFSPLCMLFILFFLYVNKHIRKMRRN